MVIVCLTFQLSFLITNTISFSDITNLTSSIGLSEVYCPTDDYLHLLRCSFQLGLHSCSGEGYTMLQCGKKKGDDISCSHCIYLYFIRFYSYLGYSLYWTITINRRKIFFTGMTTPTIPCMYILLYCTPIATPTTNILYVHDVLIGSSSNIL